MKWHFLLAISDDSVECKKCEVPPHTHSAQTGLPVVPADAAVVTAAVVAAAAAAVVTAGAAVVTAAAAVVAEVLPDASRLTLLRPATSLHVTLEVISVKEVHAVNLVFLVTKARIALSLMIRNCFLTPDAPFRTNLKPLSQPEFPGTSAKLNIRLQTVTKDGWT